MARYRPIDTRVWHDRKFLSLSAEGRLLWLFLLTAPSTLPIPGVLIGGEASIGEQLDWTPAEVRKLFGELFAKQLSVRVEGRLIWLSNALKYQPPRNPNMVKGWAETWDDIPECALKHEIWEALRIACKGWSSLFGKLFREPLAVCLPNGFTQDQEQDQEQKQDQDLKSYAPLSRSNSPLDLFKDKVDQAAGEVGKRRARKQEWQESEVESAMYVLERLGQQSGVRYSGTDDHKRIIIALFRRGITELDLRAVIGYCAIERKWAADEDMRQYLRPETLFGPKNISKYLDAARTWVSSLPEESRPQPREKGAA